MQPLQQLRTWLAKNADTENYLFLLKDLKGLFPQLSESALKTLLSRAVRSGVLVRVCRGLYLYEQAMPSTGFILFHAAAKLRANKFNYLSLETVLSDVGVISQIPMQRITLMSSGRGSVINCGRFGIIEYVHTEQQPEQVMSQLTYDVNCRLWRASVALAIRDMKITRRDTDLIDWDIADDFI